jgi:hypothetical protein
MNVDSLIKRNRLARVTSCLTLASCEITDGVGFLISGRTVNRIDLDPMSGVQTTTGGDMSFDASQKTSCFGFGPFAMSPITNAIFIGSTNVIQKRMIVSPTMTGGVLGHYVKRTTNDDFAVLITTQIDQIVAIRKRKCHLGNSCLRC